MKKLLFVVLTIFTLASCRKECNFPPAPYGNANDVSQYSSSGYNAITYTYYCYNGRYTAVTYTNTQGCTWETSYYYSTCIR